MQTQYNLPTDKVQTEERSSAFNDFELQKTAASLAMVMINNGTNACDVAPAVASIMAEVLKLKTAPEAPPTLPAKKKRRRGGPVPGWPRGLSRGDYNAWKEAKLAAGATEGINPQAMLAELEAGTYAIGAVSAAVAEDTAEDPNPAPVEAKAAKAKKTKASPPPPPPAADEAEAEASHTETEAA